MHSRVSLPYRHCAVIARSDPPPDCRRRFTASSECGDRAFRWLLLERGMLFRRLLVLRHRCCSSAATSRRHCMFQSSYSSPYCPAVWQTVTFNTVRCLATDLFVKCHLKLHIDITLGADVRNYNFPRGGVKCPVTLVQSLRWDARGRRLGSTAAAAARTLDADVSLTSSPDKHWFIAASSIEYTERPRSQQCTHISAVCTAGYPWRWRDICLPRTSYLYNAT